MLDFNTSPTNPAGNFLFGDMTVGDRFKTNLIKDVKTQQAEGGWTLEGVGLTKLEDGTEVFKTPKGYNDNPEFWKWAQNNPEFTKELYKKAIVPLRDGQPGPIPFNVTTPEGRMVQGTYDSNGVVKLNDYSPDQVRQMQNDVNNQKANEAHVGAVKVLNDSVTTGISALELAAADSAKSTKGVVDATKKFGEVARPIYKTQAEMLAGVADQIVAAGDVRASLVEGQRAALAQPEIMEKANKILNASLDFVLKSNTDRDKAKEQLDEVMSNPFYRGASVVYGGDDKNPVISSAKKTFEAAQDAAVKSQQIANSVMTGIEQFQRVAEKQFLVKTPVEVKAEAAQAAANVRIEGNKSTLAGAGTNVTEATAEANAAASIFGDKYKILREKISGLTALVQATSGVEKQALQVQLMELNRQMKIMAEEGKNSRAELRTMGMDTPEGTKLAKDWTSLNGADPENARVVAAMAKQGKTTGDPDFKALEDLRNPRLPAGMRLAAAEQLFLSGKDISKIAPGLELTVDSSQNGYKKYIQVAGITEQAAQALRAAKGDKYNPNTDNKEIIAGVQKALVASIQNPEDPLVIKVEGKELTLKASSPGKVFPGEYIPLVGTASDSAKDSPLPEAVFNRLRESKLAQAMAKQDGLYKKMPADSEGKTTVGYKDIFMLGTQIRQSDPTYTLDQFAAETRDIYQAGILLNNKYLNPTQVGLPEQKDYVINLTKQSKGQSAMAMASSAFKATMAVTENFPTLGVGNVVGTKLIKDLFSTPGKEARTQRDLQFRTGPQNAFNALKQLESVDFTNVIQFKTYVTQLDAKLWADRKVSE